MPDLPTDKQPVVIIGGGWAGLSAAVTLCAHKIPVLLLESTRQLGGRARSIKLGDMVVDNGQHLVIGAYTSLLELMKQINIEQDKVFKRLPLTLQTFDGDNVGLYLKSKRLPAPLNLLSGLLWAQGLSSSEKLKALRFIRRLDRLTPSVKNDISVLALLRSQSQSAGIIRRVWEPLCIATLNTPSDSASARLFIAVLKATFTGSAHNSDLLIPRRELSDLIPRPCADFLERRHSRIELGQRVTGLELKDQAVTGVRTKISDFETMHVILATPHVITRRLLSKHPDLQGLSNRLAKLGQEPICTLYLQYPEDTSLPLPMVGLEGTLTQWVFDRRYCGQPGLMAVVISASGKHTGLTSDELTAQVAEELSNSFPDWPPHRTSHLIREKRATFCARPGIDNVRPGNNTPVKGLWLAGDYTATGLPATLESAVSSGRHCAQQLLSSLSLSGNSNAHTRKLVTRG